MRRYFVSISVGAVVFLAVSGVPTSSQENAPLRLVQAIPMPNVKGRFDHMDADVEGKRLFVAAVDNDTLEIVDLAAGKWMRSIRGFNHTQAPWYVPELNKLFVSSQNDGMVRVFRGDSLDLIDSIKLELGPNRLMYDAASGHLYVGYGGHSAGFDDYARLGIIDARSDKLIGDIIANAGRPGHLAEIKLDHAGKSILVCDSRAGRIFVFDAKERQLLLSWPARGGDAADMDLDRSHHRLFVGTEMPPEMTVYDSESGQEVASFPTAEAMDGVYYDALHQRIYVSGGNSFGSQALPEGYVYVYQQKDADHYELVAKVQTRPGAGTSLWVPRLNRYYVAAQAHDKQEAAILVFEPQP